MACARLRVATIPAQDQRAWSCRGDGIELFESRPELLLEVFEPAGAAPELLESVQPAWRMPGA